MLKKSTTQEASVELQDTILTISLPNYSVGETSPAVIEKKLHTRYHQQATTLITQETKLLSREHGFPDNLPITIKAYRSVYGKCKHAKELFFNYRLIKLPLPIIRQVIIHELAHTKYMGHHRKFRDLVEKLDPQTSVHKQRLRKNGTSYLW